MKQGNNNRSKVIAGIMLLMLAFGVSFPAGPSAFAFNGPASGQAAGSGSGAIGVGSNNNISIGTSTTQTSTKLLVVASSTADTSSFSLKVLDSSSNPLLIIRNDGSIGIGTSSFTNTGLGALNVAGLVYSGAGLTGSLSAQNVSAGQFGANTGGGNYSFPGSVFFYNGATINSGAYTDSSGTFHLNGWENLELDTGSTPHLFVSGSTGDVGIGTANPTSLLTLNGGGTHTVNVFSGSSYNYLTLNGVTSNTGTLVGIGGGGGTDANLYFYSGLSGGGATMVLVGANVGIGTVAPPTRLDVNAGTNENFDVTGPIANASGITLSAANDGYSANVPVEIRASETTLGTEGNVGIGTTNPTSTLSVNGSASVSGNLNVGGTFSGSALTGTLNAGNVSAGTFGNNTGGGAYTFPGTLTVDGGSSSNWAGLNIGAGSSINAGGSIYSYSEICTGNSSGGCGGTGGVVLAPTGTATYGNVYLTGSGNSYLDGGDVGINETSPLGVLDIKGNSNATWGGRTIIGDDGSYDPSIRQYRWTGGGANYYASAIVTGNTGGTPQMWLQVAPSSATLGAESLPSVMILSGNGNVDVPSTLSVGSSGFVGQAGDIGASRTAAPTTGAIYLGTGGSHYLYFDGTNYNLNAGNLNVGGTLTASSYTGSITAGNVSAGTFGNNTGGGTYAFPGSVGIGGANTSPSNVVFQLGGSSGQELNFLENAAVTGSWPPVTQSSTYTIQSSGNSGGNIAFASGNTEVMRIAANGDVGIGTASPSYKLDIANAGNTYEGVGTINMSNLSGTSAQYQGISFSNSADNAILGWIGAYDANNSGYPNQSGGLVFATGPSSAEAMRINNSGQVGIGTSNINQTLSIVGDLGVGNSVSGPGVQMLNIGSAGGIVGEDENASAYNNLAFFTGASPLMTLTTGGQVGIGTTSPNGELDIYNSGDNGDGAVFAPDIDLDNNFTIQTYIDSGVSGGGWAGKTTYAGGCCNTLALQPDAGSVMVGGTSPNVGGYKLYVNGNEYVNGTLAAATYTGAVNAGNVSSGNFGNNTGGGAFSFPGDIWTAAGASVGDGYYDIAAGAIGAVNSIYSYGDICTGNNSGACTSTGGVVIGNTNSGAAVNIENNGNATFYGTVQLGASAFDGEGGDISVSRNAAPTTGAIYLGSGGAHYLFYDGTSYNLNAGGLNVGGTITGNDYLQLNAYPGYGSGTGQMYYCGTCNSFVMNNPLNVSGDVEDTNPSLGYLALTGDLPGYSASQYPTLKTNYTYMYFAANGNYTAALGGSGIFQLNGSGTTVLNSSGSSYFTGGYVGIGNASPGVELDVTGSTRTSGDLYLSTASNAPYMAYGAVANSYSFGDNSGTYFTVSTASGYPAAFAGSLTVNGYTRLYNQGGEGGVLDLIGSNGDSYYIEDINGTLRGVNNGWTAGLWSFDQSGDLSLDGNLTLAATNPVLYTGGSYLTIPYGLYVSGGTTYINGLLNARGGIGNDNASYLTISGGTTNGDTDFTGRLGIGATAPDEVLEVNGHISTTGSAPSESSGCGSGGVVTGTDTAGVIELGNSPSYYCYVYFASTYSNTPVCTISPMTYFGFGAGSPGPNYSQIPLVLTAVTTSYFYVVLHDDNVSFPSYYEFSYICIGT